MVVRLGSLPMIALLLAGCGGDSNDTAVSASPQPAPVAGAPSSPPPSEPPTASSPAPGPAPTPPPEPAPEPAPTPVPLPQPAPTVTGAVFLAALSGQGPVDVPAFENGDSTKGFLFASFQNRDDRHTQSTGIPFSPSSDLSQYPNSWIDVAYSFVEGYYTLAEDMLIADTSQFGIPLKGPELPVRGEGAVVLDRVLNQWASTEGKPWYARLEAKSAPEEPANFMICWSVSSPKVLRSSCNTFDRLSGAPVGTRVTDDSSVSGFGGRRGVVDYESIPGFTWPTATRLLQLRELWFAR